MTRKQILNKELRIGDFVKFSSGSENSRKNIWMVIDIDWEDTILGHPVVKLRLMDGTWTEQNPDIIHEVGFEKIFRTRYLQKIDVIVKRKVSA